LRTASVGKRRIEGIGLTSNSDDTSWNPLLKNASDGDDDDNGIRQVVNEKGESLFA
jgi:hypothetical protein